MTVHVETIEQLNFATDTDVVYDPGPLEGAATLFVPKPGIHYHSTQPGKQAVLPDSIWFSGLHDSLIEDLAATNLAEPALASDRNAQSHDIELVNVDLSGYAPVRLAARDYNVTLTRCDIHDALNNGIELARWDGDVHARAPQPGGFGFRMHGGSIRRTGLKPAPSAGPVHGAYIDWFDSEMLGVSLEDWSNSGITWRFGGGHIGWCDFRPTSRAATSISYFETDPVPGHTLIEACLGLESILGPERDIYLDQGSTPAETIVVRNCRGMLVNINANNRGLASWDRVLDYPRAGAAFWPNDPANPGPATADVPAAIAHANAALAYLLHSSGYKRTRSENVQDARFHLTDAYRCEMSIRATLAALRT